jgi:hypothetical protein
MIEFPLDKNNRTEHRKCNGINYLFEFMQDGWIAIWKNIENLQFVPMIQAKTVEKAEDWIYMRASTDMPLGKLV